MTPNLLASLDAAAELGKAAQQERIEQEGRNDCSCLATQHRDNLNRFAGTLDHAAIAAELRAKDAEIERLRGVLQQIADTENPEHYGNARDALHSVRLVAESALTPAAGDAHD